MLAALHNSASVKPAMRFDLLTIFPEIFSSYLNESIIKRAIQDKKLEVFVHDIRTFSKDKHHKVDATPYGGGPGMVMTPQPLYDCINHVKTLNKGYVIYLSPRGKMLTQSYAEKLFKKIETAEKKLAKAKNTNRAHSARAQRGKNLAQPVQSEASGLILVCGRYEGIDQRVIDLIVDEELSIGKYILTGGELGALIVVDVLSRLIPGVLGDDESSKEESFSKALKGKKEYPHYTRPVIFKGLEVPKVLYSGNHAQIKKWRTEETK